MFTKNGFEVELNNRFMKYFLGNFAIKAHADEGSGGDPTPSPTPNPPAPAPAPAYNSGAEQPVIDFEKLVAQARKEEKEKLYPQIEKLKNDNKLLMESNNRYLLENGTLKEQLEKAQSSDTQGARVKELETENATLKEENTKLKESAPKEEEIRSKIEAEYKVKDYLKEQLEANKEVLIPEFTKDISCATNEEVDTAIATAKEKSISVKKQLGLIDESGNVANQVNTQSAVLNNLTGAVKPQTPPPTPPVSNPPQGNTVNKLDPAYIQSLDPKSEEYAELRKKLGLH